MAILERSWQLEKSRFRGSLAGCTATIHEHLNGNVSIRYGPHVAGRFNAEGEKLVKSTAKTEEAEGRGKGWPVASVGNQKQVSPSPHRPLEIPKRDSHFPTATATVHDSPTPKPKPSPNRKPRSASSRGSAGQIE